MSKLFPQKLCYEIYPLKRLDHPIFQTVLPFDMYEAIQLGADIIDSVDILQSTVSIRFGITMSRENFIYVLSAVLKNKNYFGGYNLRNVRICTV